LPPQLLLRANQAHFLLAELDVVEGMVDVALCVPVIVVHAITTDPDLDAILLLQGGEILLDDLGLAATDVQPLHLQGQDVVVDAFHALLNVLLRSLDP
jgi:hypothetical protein